MKVKTGLLALPVLLGLLCLQLPSAVSTNLDMIALARRAVSDDYSLCDYSDELMGRTWAEQHRLLLRHGVDTASRRYYPIIAFFAGQVLTNGNSLVQSDSGVPVDDLGLLFAGLAATCSDSPVEQRLEWARAALSVSKNSGDRATVLRQVGRFYVEEGQWADAVAVYEELAAMHPTDEAAIRRLGMAYFFVHDYSRAASVLDESLATAETAGRLRSLVFLGASYYHLGQYERALVTLAQAEEESDGSHSQAHLIHYFRGLTLERLGDSDAALTAYDTAVALKPTYDAALLRLAELHLAHGDLSVAEAYADRLSPAVRSRDEAACLILHIKTCAGKVSEVDELRQQPDAGQGTCGARPCGRVK